MAQKKLELWQATCPGHREWRGRGQRRSIPAKPKQDREALAGRKRQTSREGTREGGGGSASRPSAAQGPGRGPGPQPLAARHSSSRKRRDRGGGGCEAPPLPTAPGTLGVVVPVASTARRASRFPARAPTSALAVGSAREVGGRQSRRLRATAPDSASRPASRAAPPCGSGSPGARFTAPRAPRARRSLGAPAGRYATEAAQGEARAGPGRVGPGRDACRFRHSAREAVGAARRRQRARLPSENKLWADRRRRAGPGRGD